MSKKEMYNSLHESTQTFSGIKCFEVINGNIVLRGRKGIRDHIIPLEKSVDKYYDTIDLVHKYALYGIRGWDTLKDLADELKYRILEAVKQRESLKLPVDEKVLKFCSTVKK